MSLVHNERTKLTATWLNALASGMVVTGVIAPAVAVFYGVLGPGESGAAIIGISGLVWLFTGTALHFIALATLRRLRP